MKTFALILGFLLSPFLSLAQDIPLFDTALAQVGLTSEDLRFDRDEMAGWGGDRWRLTYFTMFHQNPLKLPKYGQINLEGFSTDVTNITALISGAGRRIDCPVRRGLIGEQLAEWMNFPDSFPKPSITSNRNVLTGEKYKTLRQKIDLFFRVVDDPKSMFKQSINEINKDKHRIKLYQYFVADSQQYNDDVEAMVDKVDFNRMIGGAEDIAESLRRLADSLEFCEFPSFRVEIKTHQGLIVVGTKEDDNYAYIAPPLLIIDGGGNDTYSYSGYPDDFPLAAIVDAEGNDRYISTDSLRPGIGGAVIGMSVLIDKAGDDIYQAKNLSLGSGLFGVAVLCDKSGNDKYSSRSYTQGCGQFGVGILIDSVGNDSLYCYANAQGYGYTKGCGLCINYAGNDVYIAEDSILFAPASQTKEHNSSLAQGVGFGRRADYIDGHSWAGGVGILCDVSGDDHYSAGLFAQGCGYWFAVGMLLDGAGNDRYDAVWYDQGSGAHFAVGYLDDFAGDDIYTATMNMSIGSGHDFTIGYFNERGGNDVYNAPTLSVGAGNFQGMGIFDDWSGDDTYNTHGGAVLGRSNPLNQGPRAFLNTFGVFLDRGGNDSYKEPWASNSAKWIGPKSDTTKPSAYEIGVGVDE
ncbi:MAG: hypothetical protein AB1644_09740 [Candidatus Zixiibacteriota bacterium]